MGLWAATYYVGQPPLQWPIGGWLSCLAFATLVACSPEFSRRDALHAWLVGSLLWLFLLHGIRLAFWPLTAGWIALSLYLGIYFPAALAMAHGLRRRLGFATPLACAVAWTAGEVLRAYVVTGFAGCMLVHSQTPWPSVLPIASHFGGYGVGFMMMLAASWLVAFVVSIATQERPGFWGGVGRNSLAIMVMLWLTSSFSGLRVRDAYLGGLQPLKPLGSFLLIQDHMPTMFDATPGLIEQGWMQYAQTMQRAVRSLPADVDIDVVIWPESVFTGLAPYFDWDRGPSIPPELEWDLATLEQVDQRLRGMHESKLRLLASIFDDRRPHLLMGTDVMVIRDGQLDRYNAALWMDGDTLATDYYAKNHLVMFGEYIPVLSWFPDLLKGFGLGTLSSGKEPKAWRIRNGIRLTPSICFEDVVPHLMQAHIRRLTRSGSPPDLLVNISNDGWFRGSSILDHHLNSAILTAVENRVPVLVAANTGLTAWIDGDGRVIEQLPRMEPGWILAQPPPDGRVGWWSWWGDFPARCIAVLGVMPLAFVLVDRLRKLRPVSKL